MLFALRAATHKENKPWFYEHAAKLNKGCRDTFIKLWPMSHLTGPGRTANSHMFK